MSKPRKKVTIAKNSGDHNIEECNHKIQGSFIHHHPKNAKEGKEIVTVHNPNGQETLIIPSREPLDIPGILPSSDFKRLLKQSKVLTAEEKKAKIEEVEERRRQELLQSEKRKEFIRSKLISTAAKGTILEEAEAEAIKNNQYMLQRSRELREEQQDEIKTLNGIILASKCLAIREAQIKEKKLIEKGLAEEEFRLDMMMEQERQRGLMSEKKKQEEVEARSKQFVLEMNNQMRGNEIEASLNREKRLEEARNSNELLMIYQRQQMEESKQKMEKQRKAVEEFRLWNEEHLYLKALKEEEERLHDLRIKEFLRQKEQTEKAKTEQEQHTKATKEVDLARVAAAVREKEEQLRKREELNLLRLHEEAERDWRRKEKEAAIKRKQDMEKLQSERKKQIDDIRKFHAIEMAKEEQEYFKLCQVQAKTIEEETQKKNAEKEKALKNRKDILRQINEREKLRIDERRRTMEEGEVIRLEDSLRKQQLQEALDRKLEALKNCNIPEKTIQDIKRQADIKIKSRIK